ncbi:MAG TPA: phage portal protein [Anaerolineaceae bacterium]|nr:phage portal protein [Anaerolineaceae bacterium]HPK26186.1 phage portal protein [Anaerolineaceae bacterium]
MSIFSGLFRSRDKPKNRVGGGWNFLFGGTTSGKAVNERTAMQTSAVYACVRILAESVAGLPLHVYERTANGSKSTKPSHPLYRLLHDEPNREMTSFVFRETLMSHLLLWGNAYAQIIRDGRGFPIALYPLLPDRMAVDRNESGELVYTYQSDKGQVKLRRENILHIPGLGFDGLIGYSPIAMAKNAVGLALATEDYGATFFANGANPGGVLEHPGVIKPEQADRLRESWQSQFGGANAHKVAVLEEGLKFHQMSIPPEQAQFLETRKFQINEIARIFRVPPHMVGDLEKSSFSNIEQQSLEFVKYTLDPWVVRWEQSLQQVLILPSEKATIFIKFNLDGLLRGDYQSRMQGYSTGIQNGFMSVNDVRGLEDMNLLTAEEGGDLHFVNGNMVKLADVGAAYKPNETEDTS